MDPQGIVAQDPAGKVFMAKPACRPIYLNLPALKQYAAGLSKCCDQVSIIALSPTDAG